VYPLPTSKGVFLDRRAIHQEDPDAEGEARFIAVGAGSAGQGLVVVYALRGNNIRLVSARRVTRREVSDYES